MSNTTNILARLFDWLGETFERFNPAAFRFLAATLPYLTPVPVAWLTSQSASEFLNFTPQVAFIFVFCLEGIGLWFTSLLVDSVVQWIRSRNTKAFAGVVMFGLAVAAYIFILVNLNVTLEAANGKMTPALSRVITLLCFLPLLSGVGNGWYKLQLDTKVAVEVTRNHTEAREDRIRKDNNDLKLKRTMVKQGLNPFVETPKAYQAETKAAKPRSVKSPSFYKERMWDFMLAQYSATHTVPTIAEIAAHFGLEYKKASGYIHGQRKSFLASHGITN